LVRKVSSTEPPQNGPPAFEPCTIRSLEVGGLTGSATRTPRAQAPNTEPRPSGPGRGSRAPAARCAWITRGAPIMIMPTSWPLRRQRRLR